jgi:2'-5' RNA ligase
VRLFVGVELEETVRAECAAAVRDIQQRLRVARGVDVRWIPDANLHITLVFLGHVDTARAARVHEVLQSPWGTRPFEFRISGAGAFPPSGPPRILWLGTGDGTDALVTLYTEASSRLASVGFEPERRPYHPHVTIGRVKEASREAGRRLRTVLEEAVTSSQNRVDAVTLFESRLSPAGARYEALLRVPLKGC